MKLDRELHKSTLLLTAFVETIKLVVYDRKREIVLYRTLLYILGSCKQFKSGSGFLNTVLKTVFLNLYTFVTS